MLPTLPSNVPVIASVSITLTTKESRRRTNNLHKWDLSSRIQLSLERGSSAVECRTLNQESMGFNPLCYRFEAWKFSLCPQPVPQSTQLYQLILNEMYSNHQMEIILLTLRKRSVGQTWLIITHLGDSKRQSECVNGASS